MKKRLYIVSTYYHALISCVKQLTEPRASDILVTGYIPDGFSLYGRIKESGIFSGAFWNDNVTEYKPENKLDYFLNYHRKNAALIEEGLSVPVAEYDDIHIFHEDTWFAHYLKDKKIPYHLNEDALDIYKMISKTSFAYMLPKNNLKYFIKRLLRIGYVFCGYDYCAESIEVNSLDGLEITEFAGKRLVEVPRQGLFDKLTEKDIGTLKEIFAKEVPVTDYKNSALLLTQPLFSDGKAESMTQQLDIFLELAKKNVMEGESLIIKPHPRDTADYSSVFPDAVILDKNMPAEILKFICPGGFKKIVKLTSCTVIY